MVATTNTGRRTFLKGAAAALATASCAGSAVAAADVADPIFALHERLLEVREEYRTACAALDRLYEIEPDENLELVFYCRGERGKPRECRAKTRQQIFEIFERQRWMYAGAEHAPYDEIAAAEAAAQRAFDQVDAAHARRAELGFDELEALTIRLDGELYDLESAVLSAKPATIAGLIVIAGLMAELEQQYEGGDPRVSAASIGLVSAMRELLPANA